MATLQVLQEQKERLNSLKTDLHRLSAPAAEALIEHKANDAIQCFACGHRCLVKPGRDGVCRVRFNDNGVLRVPYGYVGALACDPIEKKPFFHVLPGSDALTFGMLGCDFHCGYCQNWVTSQMLRDPKAVAPARLTNPGQLVDLAIQHRAPVVASSYNEPLITSEWAVDVFKEARGRGLRCAYISNGNGTPQVLDFIRPYVDAYKVDLKTFNPQNYRQLGGVLENVTQTIRDLKQRGFWVEIVTLVVPGFSDDADDLKRMAEFIASIDPLMPWHMTAFHPDYKMTDGYRQTTPDDLWRIVQFGMQAGLKYMYPGNLPGRVGGWEDTRCHHCNATVIQRYGFIVKQNRVGPDGLCPDCNKPLPGIWGQSSGHGDGRVRRLT
ncbi:MAG TPA: AmmeMemoRadiSam system radical SAM enzyme [Tepidisphaeraceae bacterium]|jgi:pyruvate formate lyase activating enzyme|nr:AmmeMemoRadiSam system radical SAM enzyme [Tepidisphaeraceae bacterium]